jgi:hypothetical protein
MKIFLVSLLGPFRGGIKFCLIFITLIFPEGFYIASYCAFA